MILMSAKLFAKYSRIRGVVAAATFVMGLSACAGGLAQRAEPALYDLSEGVLPSSTAAATLPWASAVSTPSEGPLPWLLEGVHAPGWLDTPVMQYRLMFDAPERRRAYVDSRWVAPPAELLASVMSRRRLVRAGRPEPQSCRLRVDIDEFVQYFDTADRSQVLLEVRLTLLGSQDGRVLAQQSLRVVQPAGVDARSGVAAYVVAVRVLGDRLQDWLQQMTVARDGVAQTCHAAKL